MKAETLISQHMNAFRYFGGYTSAILYDNRKQVVLDRKVKASESTFNPLFMDFLEFHGIWPRLCHPYRPQTKGKIENTVKFVRGNFWNGTPFTSLADLNAQALQWCDSVNGRVHRTTGEIPFDRLKLEGLNTIQGHPVYVMKLTDTRRVSRDCYVSYRGNRYSVPWKHAGREASVTELGGRRTWTGAHALECIMSAYRTCRKKKQDFRATVLSPGFISDKIFHMFVNSRLFAKKLNCHKNSLFSSQLAYDLDGKVS